MLDVPADVLYLWLGLSAASVAVLGAAVGLPTAAPPDATAAARTIDSVAASPYAALGQHPLAADEIRLSAGGISLRDEGGTAHAVFAYGPIAPVRRGPLRAVLRGVPPSAVFDSPTAFAQAIAAARRDDPEWRRAPDRLVVRRVTWEEVDVTLVG